MTLAIPRNVLLFTGGMDSTAVFLGLVRRKINFFCAIFNYGQMAYAGELSNARYWARKYDVRLEEWSNSTIREHNSSTSQYLLGEVSVGSPILDARNLLLVLDAAKHAENIYTGIVQWKFDQTPAFVRDLNSLLRMSYVSRKVRVLAPMLRSPRYATTFRGAYRFDEEFFLRTSSCWQAASDGSSCGECPKCLTRAKFLRQALPISLVRDGQAFSEQWLGRTGD